VKSLRIFLIVILTACVNTIDAQTVYTTKTGKKYHEENCRFLKDSKKEITLQKAKSLGYTPCSVCKPITGISETKETNSATSVKASESNNNNTVSISKPKSISSQCTGKTKSGERCKRMTKNANGKCYQHQ